MSDPGPRSPEALRPVAPSRAVLNPAGPVQEGASVLSLLQPPAPRVRNPRARDVRSSEVVIGELCARSHAAWDAYVDGHALATCYHLRAWQRVAAHAYRLDAPYLLARRGEGGPVCGVLPLVLVRNLLGGYATTGLFGAYGPTLADTPEIGRALLQSAQGITESAGLGYLLVKALGDEPLATGFSRRNTCVVAKLPLCSDPAELWRGFRDKSRNSVRKGQKAGLTAHHGPGELEGYYDVLAENMHRKGTPIYGLEFMRTLLEALGDRGEVVTLHHEDRTVSAALVVYSHGTACVPFASSRLSSLRYSPNNLLYWEIMQRACARGMKVLDFGRSPCGASTLAFKLGWGAHTTPAPFYVYTARGRPPRLETHTPGVELLARLWQRLPRGLADALGPAVCARFLA